MHVVWTQPAVADVVQIREYIAQNSRRYARVVAERLLFAVEQLPAFPLSGRMVPELNDPALREIIESPYRIVYRVRADLIEIVTVVHTAREFPVESLRGAL